MATIAAYLCICNDGAAVSLEHLKVYRRIPDRVAGKHGMLRIIDESGEDYLYPEAWFVAVRVPASVQKVFPTNCKESPVSRARVPRARPSVA
jgi:hypothetical protein